MTEYLVNAWPLQIFPRITKCTFQNYGPSGSVQIEDALCMLPWNSVNEKIYIAVWFWLVFLSLLTLINVIYQLVEMFSPALRLVVLSSVAPTPAQSKRAPHTSHSSNQVLVEQLGVADYVMVTLLAKNIDPFTFRWLVDRLATLLVANDHLQSDFS